ncbi:MAG: hypothetical protein FWG13_05615 [Leptospirales bacterium]|nr:hypothetical protein [Leptospirales bacterium]
MKKKVLACLVLLSMVGMVGPDAAFPAATKNCPDCKGKKEIVTQNKCSDCAGTGKITCKNCDGKVYLKAEDFGKNKKSWMGHLECMECEVNASIRHTGKQKCAPCKGKGKYDVKTPCKTCKGTGKVG